MKKITRSIAALFVVAGAIAFTSCDDFLTEDLKGDYSSTNIYSSATYAEQAVNGIYAAARYSINLWRFGDITSDDAVKGGKPGDAADLDHIMAFDATADNGELLSFWKNTYEVIARANNVLYGISGKKFDTEARMAGEAKFLRAYSYFQLVNIFGRVPLKLKAQNTESAIYVGLSSVEDIYAQIEADLKDAAEALPEKYDAANEGRATKGAALGLLAKVQLYQNKYNDALTSIKALKALNIYQLDDYANLFRLGNEKSPEAVWAIRFKSDEVIKIGNRLNQDFAPMLKENGYYWNNPTENWVNSFTETTVGGDEDPRIDLSIGREGHQWFEEGNFKKEWSTTGYLVKKHCQPASEVPHSSKADGGLAYLYLRYADVLLMEAECYVELGQPDNALAPLNEVRARVDLAPLTTATRDAVRLERRHELAFEFHRFFDLMRWGKATATSALATKDGVTFTCPGDRFYFPIPQSELDANHAIK